MKTIIALVFASMMAMNAIADKPVYHSDKYCVKMKDGKKVVMHEGNELTSEVTLNNGTKVHANGTIVKKDGTKMMLKNGECINKDGIVAEEKEKKEKAK